MSDDSSGTIASRVPRRWVVQPAVGLAYLVAMLHIFHPRHGFGRLLTLASTNPDLLVSTPRPVAFVLSALAIVAAVPLIASGVPRQPIYALGMALMLTYVGGYAAWHLSGHGGFLPGREPLYHGLAPHEALLVHVTGDLWAATAVFAEVVLFALLWVLYRRDS